MTKVIELRPDTNLINTKFLKYQFSSNTANVKFKKELQTEIFHCDLNTSQYSWLETRLFVFHNHLFKNPYNSTCMFIDKNGGIWRFRDNQPLSLIYTSKIIGSSSLKYIYNPSIAFASKDIFIISNGAGAIEFLIENDCCIKNLLFDDTESAIILDARFIKESSNIILALYKIDEEKGKKFSRLVFLSYDYDKNSTDESHSLKLVKKQYMKVQRAIEHIYIEESGNFCYIISQDQVEFDSNNQNNLELKIDNSINNCPMKIPKYCWSQDEESVTVFLKIPEKYSDVNIKVGTTSTSISITIADIILLNGETSNRLESDLTTWKRKGDNLEIELYKSETGLMWQELITSDTGGEYLPNNVLTAEIHSRLSHLCSNENESIAQGQPVIGFNSEQLEECDLSGTENVLQRINLNTENITHMAMLGNSNSVLFADKQSFGHAVCLRHEHDGCIWIMSELDNKDWNLKHKYTFPGFGYVEASKTNKKFCVSPTDGSFIAIIENTRHAFLYEKPDIDVEIGIQRILDLGTQMSPILGATVINKDLIILTKDELYQLQI